MRWRKSCLGGVNAKLLALGKSWVQ